MKRTDDEPLPLDCPYCGSSMTVVRRGVSGAFLSYYCATHGRFWLDHDGQLRQERRSADGPTSPRQVGENVGGVPPVPIGAVEASDPIPLNCPRCGVRLAVVRVGVSGDLVSYQCQKDGRFWLDDEGRLRHELRSQDRPIR